jgi:hypothetical protein
MKRWRRALTMTAGCVCASNDGVELVEQSGEIRYLDENGG